MSQEFPDVQARFRKGRGTRDQITNIQWITEKARKFQKNMFHWLRKSLWLCGSQQTAEKFFKRYQTTLPVSWETCTQVKKKQLESDMKQQTGSKLGKEYIKVVYCHHEYLISMQSTSCEVLGWMNYKVESRLLGEISTTSDMQMIQF